MADLASVRAEIDRARKLVDRQRRDIIALQRSGIDTADAELVLAGSLRASTTLSASATD